MAETGVARLRTSSSQSMVGISRTSHSTMKKAVAVVDQGSATAVSTTIVSASRR